MNSLDNSLLPPKPIQRPPPALECVDDVVGGDGPAVGVLGVGDGVADHVGEEVLEHRAGLLVHQSRETLHTAAARETTDGRTGDPFDVVAEHLAVALGSSLAEAFAAFALAEDGCHHLVDLRGFGFSDAFIVFHMGRWF